MLPILVEDIKLLCLDDTKGKYDVKAIGRFLLQSFSKASKISSISQLKNG